MKNEEQTSLIKELTFAEIYTANFLAGKQPVKPNVPIQWIQICDIAWLNQRGCETNHIFSKFFQHAVSELRGTDASFTAWVAVAPWNFHSYAPIESIILINAIKKTSNIKEWLEIHQHCWLWVTKSPKQVGGLGKYQTYSGTETALKERLNELSGDVDEWLYIYREFGSCKWITETCLRKIGQIS